MLYRETVASDTFQLLNSICELPMFKNFALAGGTSLALQIGHRISVDLDFFGNERIDSIQILQTLNHIKPLSIISQNNFMVVLNIKNIKVDFVDYQYPLLKELIIHDNVRLYSIEDIAAMKLAAIAGRGRKRDFFDLHFLLDFFSLGELLKLYNLKFQDGSAMMVVRSLTFFEDADLDEDPVVLNSQITWDQVKENITNKVKTLF